jgi:hypothetical protein
VNAPQGGSGSEAGSGADAGAGTGPARFVLYSRFGCGLCEEMLLALTALPAAAGLPVEVVDVDTDAAARVRYGHKIPVLLFAGELVCRGHLDPTEVDKALAHHRRPV